MFGLVFSPKLIPSCTSAFHRKKYGYANLLVPWSDYTQRRIADKH